MTSDARTGLRIMTDTFPSQVAAVVEADSMRRVRQAVVAVVGGEPSAPRLAGSTRAPAPLKAAMRHRPRQLCPVPGCKGVPAPVFGMMCAKHKDVRRAKIAEYRAQGRATKAGA